MLVEPRPIRPEEVDVIRVTLEHALVHPVDDDAVQAIPGLTVVARCECGCASVDFEERALENPWMPLGDGMGTTPRGAQVGIIVWGRRERITGLEVYGLGAGNNDLTLPVPASVVSWSKSGAAAGRTH